MKVNIVASSLYVLCSLCAAVADEQIRDGHHGLALISLASALACAFYAQHWQNEKPR